MKYLKFLILCAIIILPIETYSQTTRNKMETHVYKTRGFSRYKLTVYQPPNIDLEKKIPAIILFHGGGLNYRFYWYFEPHSEYLAEKGLVAIIATYRVKKNGLTIFESVADAKSAIRWVREHADELGIDENRIASGGGSAGGFLAACAALTKKDYDEKKEDLSISSVPNALVLFNPRLDLSAPQISKDLTKKAIRYKKGRNVDDLSPVLNVHKGAPPTIIFQGTADTIVFVQEAQKFCEEMEKYGNSCEVILYEGREHGFFLKDRGDEDLLSTMKHTVRFLSELGYISQDDNNQ